MHMRLHAFLIAIASTLLFAVGIAVAGVAPLPADPCDADCAEILKGLLEEEQSRWFPVMNEPAERFAAEDGTATACAERTAEPILHAIVLAPFYDHFLKLPGTQNDAALLRELFQQRGVQPANLHVLDGNATTRGKIVGVMRAIVACVRERDQVVLTFSGGASSYKKWGAVTGEFFMERRCSGDDLAAEVRDLICAPDVQAAATAVVDEQLPDVNEVVLFSSDVNFIPRYTTDFHIADGTTITGIRASELANFSIQLQNRGADAVFVLDTNFAEDVRLLEALERARFDATWRWVRNQDDAPADAPAGVELFGSGEMAAFYATQAEEWSFETGKTGGLVLGELTFAVSEALRSLPNPTVESLSREIDRTMAAEALLQIPVFEATDPHLRILATREEPEANSDHIEIINPKLTRGAIAIEVPEVEIVARYDGPEPAAFASVDGLNVEINVNGQFQRAVKLKSRTEVPIRVFGRDASLLAEKRVLFGEDAVEASLSPVGRRLALLIANQNYADPAFRKLETPIGDAEALAGMLADNFGFTTDLETASGQRSLFLKDATKAEIQRVLFDLRKSLTAADQLVVFYAGHGQIDQESTAYWVPVDGDRSEDFTWVRAFEITEDLRKLAAGSVLLISDSCYAGGLSRSGEQDASTEARERYLAKSTRYKARQLMASGGNEPVLDGGGRGHSLFARALLEGLKDMPEKIFTASELFANKVKPKAVEFAFATSAKGQTPVYYRMTNAGDEPESEFVFVRK